jgi:hypothetical protein
VKSIGVTTAPFNTSTAQAIRKLYPPFDKLKYVIFAGCVWIALSTNILDAMGESKNLCTFIPYSARNKSRVILSKIFLDSDIRNTDALEATEVLMFVDDVEIFSISSLQDQLLKARKHKYVTLKFKSKKELVIEISRAIDQDKYIHENYKITPNQFSLTYWQ